MCHMTVSNVASVGFGVIGQSWARLFLTHGLHVTVFDPRPDLADVVAATEKAAGVPAGTITIAPTAEAAAKDADWVQEAGPENVDWKRETFAAMLGAAPSTAIIATSSSAIPATLIAKNLDDAGAARVLVGHPFNPPHVMPLVEVVPGERTSEEATNAALEFYRAVGKSPIRINKEIPGFVGNRLQIAIIREAVSLVQAGVITAEDLDTLVETSIGTRWAAVGPFKAFHLGGGPQGLAHLVEHVLRNLDEMATPLPYDFSAEAMKPLLDSVNDAYGLPPKPEIAEFRDAVQEATLTARAEAAKKLK